jgi:hypothetical protein
MEKKIWLFVPENRYTKGLVENLDINKKIFEDIKEFYNFLINEKRHRLLDKYGLILGVRDISKNNYNVPNGWWEKNKYLKDPESGFTFGLTLYEEMIIDGNGKPIWDPLPPVIFLTELIKTPQILERIRKIEKTQKLNYYNNKIKKEPQVFFQSMEDMNQREFIQKINEWGYLQIIKKIDTIEEFDKIHLITDSCINPNEVSNDLYLKARSDFEKRISEYIFYSINDLEGYFRIFQMQNDKLINYMHYNRKFKLDSDKDKMTQEEFLSVLEKIALHYDNSMKLFFKKSSVRTFIGDSVNNFKTFNLKVELNPKPDYIYSLYNGSINEFIDIKEMFK